MSNLDFVLEFFFSICVFLVFYAVNREIFAKSAAEKREIESVSVKPLK